MTPGTALEVSGSPDRGCYNLRNCSGSIWESRKRLLQPQELLWEYLGVQIEVATTSGTALEVSGSPDRGCYNLRNCSGSIWESR